MNMVKRAAKDKSLPGGAWFYIGRLPKSTTAEQLSEFFSNIGLDLPPERFSVKQHRDYAGAIVSIDRATTHRLLKWAINGQKFQGHAVEPQIFGET